MGTKSVFEIYSISIALWEAFISVLLKILKLLHEPMFKRDLLFFIEMFHMGWDLIYRMPLLIVLKSHGFQTCLCCFVENINKVWCSICRERYLLGNLSKFLKCHTLISDKSLKIWPLQTLWSWKAGSLPGSYLKACHSWKINLSNLTKVKVFMFYCNQTDITDNLKSCHI